MRGEIKKSKNSAALYVIEEIEPNFYYTFLLFTIYNVHSPRNNVS